MLIWINGTFGVGKTQVAHELARRIPGSVISDPELLGFGIQRMYPPTERPDFQLTPWWAPVAAEILVDVSRGQRGPVIVPMTLPDPQRHAQVTRALRAGGVEVAHFALLADRAVVLRRLRRRLDGPRSWAAAQYDRCTTALRQPAFATHIETGDRGVTEVAELVAGLAGLTLAPRDDNPLRAALRRTAVQARHVRFG
jgi:predicted kinase